MTVKSCLKSMRLRTLPLSLAGVIAGIALASKVAAPDAPTVAALIFTTAFLQILSNLSNELGDTLHGTDTAERQGIHYSIQDGEMTIPQMKKLIALIAGLCCVSGLIMVMFSFREAEGLKGLIQGIFAVEPICLLVLGAAAIWAAMHYTLGNNPYGYRGLGDIFVFIFFGLVAVMGAAYVCSHTILSVWILPGAAFGCWSIGVLNVNNIRDMKTDSATRTTVALKLGLRKARIYQTILIASGWLLMLAFNLLKTANIGVLTNRPSIESRGILGCLYFITIPLFALHLRGVWTREERALDPMLPMLVMTTFATAILFVPGL